MSGYFEGLYFKHQLGSHTVAFIVGRDFNSSFIQLINHNRSHCFFYPADAFRVYADSKGRQIVNVAGNEFSCNGIQVDIQRDGCSIRGKISYNGLTPLRYDIMGPFKYLPMQCRHSVVSLHHALDGSICLDGQQIDFRGGTGYIEGDSGTSFPSAYAWFHCNDFPQKASVMASVANIPLAGLHFLGCIACVYWGGKEYRLATYLGAKIIRCDEGGIIIQQGRLNLDIGLEPNKGQPLLAPQQGRMTREIRERAVCRSRISFTKAGKELLYYSGDRASFEYADLDM